MTRLLRAIVAVAGLLAGLMALAAALWAVPPGATAFLRDPALPSLLAQAAVPAAGAAALALVPGLAAATSIRHAGGLPRLVAFAIAICLLLLPAPLLTGWPSADELARGNEGGLPYAVGRGTALVMLITAPAITGITPGLRRAARMAGATPLRAWRHVVLAQIWRPVCVGWLASAIAALAQTPAFGVIARRLDTRPVWLIAISLLLIACSALALGAPRRLRHGRAGPRGQAYLQ